MSLTNLSKANRRSRPGKIEAKRKTVAAKLVLMKERKRERELRNSQENWEVKRQPQAKLVAPEEPTTATTEGAVGFSRENKCNGLSLTIIMHWPDVMDMSCHIKLWDPHCRTY